MVKERLRVFSGRLRRVFFEYIDAHLTITSDHILFIIFHIFYRKSSVKVFL